MKTRRLVVPILALLIVGAVFTVVPRADEGFWPYNAIPRDVIKKKFGFQVTDAWLNHLQLATVRFSGGTGSVVSPNGLVLTNHHIGLSTLQRFTTAERDLVKNGFFAKSMADEIKVPNMSLRILQSIEDVTAKVNAALKPGMTPQDRQAAFTAITSADDKTTGLSSEIVTLYRGAKYNLYRYKVYTDVRLVCGVEYQVGFYGGDPDNFTYPRYNLDVSMFRLYENDKPANTPNYLHWSPNGTKEGDLVFVTGHPGTTQRLNTVEHFKFLRDVQLPYQVASLEQQQASIKKQMAQSADNARNMTSQLFGVENSLKRARGQLSGLQIPAYMARLEASEKALREGLAKQPDKQKELGDAWDQIAKSIQVAREMNDQRNFIAGNAAINSQLFTIARNIVRSAYNPPSADQGRAGRGGAGGGRGAAPQRAPGGRGAAPAGPINTAVEKANIVESLNFMKAHVAAGSPVPQMILGGKTPEQLAAELVDKTRIQDAEIQAILTAGGKAAVDAATDPMIVFARKLEAATPEINKKYDEQVTAVQAANYVKVAQAVFAVYGEKAYPDATGTLRLSYGTVKGYMEDGKKIPPYTDFAGFFARAAQHNNEMPYTVAPSWAENKAAINLKTPFDFVSTNDTVGGNSGSALVNKNGELIGLLFDGNIQSNVGYYLYDEAINRTVSVDSRAIVEAFRKIYKANWLADEMTGKTKKATTN